MNRESGDTILDFDQLIVRLGSLYALVWKLVPFCIKASQKEPFCWECSVAFSCALVPHVSQKNFSHWSGVWQIALLQGNLKLSTPQFLTFLGFRNCEKFHSALNSMPLSCQIHPKAFSGLQFSSPSHFVLGAAQFNPLEFGFLLVLPVLIHLRF